MSEEETCFLARKVHSMLQLGTAGGSLRIAHLCLPSRPYFAAGCGIVLQQRSIDALTKDI
jgi:hypothetical protein